MDNNEANRPEGSGGFNDYYKDYLNNLDSLSGASSAPQNVEIPSVTSASAPISEPISAPTPDLVQAPVSELASLQTTTPENVKPESTTSENVTTENATPVAGVQSAEPAKEPKEPKVKAPTPSIGYTVAVIIITVVVTFATIFAASKTGILNLGPVSSNYSASSYNAEQANKAYNKESGTPDWNKIFADIAPSVVSIQVSVTNGTELGSGFIFDTNGNVITNDHVISDAANGGKIQVTLYDGRLYEGKVVGTDPTTDIAVIHLEGATDGLKPVTFGNSDDLTVGDDVLAVGNPLGLSNTATTGIISALDRPVTAAAGGTKTSSSSSLVITNAIQVDADVNPGNSGGPLFNANGAVVGITSSIAQATTTTTGSIGLGFAIPAKLTQLVVQQLIESGKAEHPAIGVTISDGTIEIDGASRRAAIIQQVGDSSPAKSAGLQKDDAIIAVDGKPITSTYSLIGHIRESALNSTVTVTYVRNGAKSDVSMKLDKKQDEALSGLNTQKPSQDNQNGNKYDLFDPFGDSE